jgi:hypothetical protein
MNHGRGDHFGWAVPALGSGRKESSGIGAVGPNGLRSAQWPWHGGTRDASRSRRTWDVLTEVGRTEPGWEASSPP